MSFIFLKMIVPVIMACLFNTVANTLWKMYFFKKPLNISSFENVLTVFLSLQIILGVFFYFCSMLLFFYMLSRFNLSLIIPLTSLTYILNMLAAFFIFKERISSMQICGTIIIIIGIFVLMRANSVNLN